MYERKDLVDFGKSIGDQQPELPYCISTINDALSHGIIQYVANLVKRPTPYAEKIINFWPFVRKNDLTNESTPELRKAFNGELNLLGRVASHLNKALSGEPAIAKALDTMFGGQHDDIFTPSSDTDVPTDFVFLYDDLTHKIKGEHTTVDDIEFSKQLAKIGLTDPKVVNIFLSLSKNILAKDSKYRRYDMETESFREAFPQAKEEQ